MVRRQATASFRADRECGNQNHCILGYYTRAQRPLARRHSRAANGNISRYPYPLCQSATLIGRLAVARQNKSAVARVRTGPDDRRSSPAYGSAETVGSSMIVVDCFWKHAAAGFYAPTASRGYYRKLSADSVLFHAVACCLMEP